MTETHSLGDWEEEFDEKFPLKYSSEPKPLMISCTEHHAPASPTELKNFIRSLLLAQKEGFRREIERLKKGMEGQSFPPGNGLDYAIARSKWQSKFEQTTGYNQALHDLLTKLDTNLI